MNKQLLAATCVLLASKFYEIDDNLILSDDIQRKVDKKVTYEDLTRAELQVLDKLEWNLLRVMPLDFVQAFTRLGQVQNDDVVSKDRIVSSLSQSDQDDLTARITKQCLKLTEFCSHQLKLDAEWKPSELGFAILLLSRQLNSIKHEWNLDLLGLYVKE